MNAAPFFSRVCHQCRTEWRHQSGIVLLWLALLVLRQWYRRHLATEVFSKLSYADLDLWLEAGLLLMAAALVWRCVSADAPSNTDTFSLTRPVGQAALWYGKLLFVVSGVILPAVLVLGSSWRGFGLGWEHWLALSAAVIFTGGLVCSFAGGLTALAATSRQVMALALLAVLGAGVWLAMWERFSDGDVMTLEQRHVQQCGSAVAALICLAGLLTSWWLATVSRRRLSAASLMLGTLVASPLIARAWRTDWITRPHQSYANAAKLAVKVGKADPADKAPGRGLWPTLRIVGLGKDEVASIIEFAPINENTPWPPEGSYSDLTVNDSGSDSWLRHEHTRALFKHAAPTTLWRDNIDNDVMYNGRKSLAEVLKMLHLNREDVITLRWRLRLAVHEMKRIATVPFRQFWTQENSFFIRPGLRLEFNVYSLTRKNGGMHGRVHRVSSALLPTDTHRSAHARGRDLGDDFFLVLEDRELRENLALSLGLVERERNPSLYRDIARPWQNDENQGFETHVHMPSPQIVILQTTRDEWIDHQDASFWHAEERGTVEFELTPEQMAQVLAEPKTEEKKP